MTIKIRIIASKINKTNKQVLIRLREDWMDFSMALGVVFFALAMLLYVTGGGADKLPILMIGLVVGTYGLMFFQESLRDN